MHFPIRRTLSTSSVIFNISSRFPRPIAEMSPKFKFLNSQTSQSSKAINDETSTLAEVLRCHAYFDETVFHNTIEALNSKITGSRVDLVRLARMRYIAVVYHAISDTKKRELLKNLAEKVEKCNIRMFQSEQDLFYKSMNDLDVVPMLTKCIHTNDLVLCYFRKSLENKNWENIKKLLSLYPKSIPFYEHIDVFLEVTKERNIESSEVLEVFMKYAVENNRYFVEYKDFETVFRKVINAVNMKSSEIVIDRTEKSYISKEDLDLLKKRIDECIKTSKEGYVKTEEYKRIEQKVAEWMRKKKIKNGRNVVIVDALNFGKGGDPKEWKNISDNFEHVFFATRTPPSPIRGEVTKRYKGNALFCDRLSADDLLILRMALEFGPQTSLVTNDRYRDHRLNICDKNGELEKIWDEFLIDATYRHFDGRIEARRDFNLRVRKQDDGWIVPVLEFEGYSPEFRRLKIYSIHLDAKKK